MGRDGQNFGIDCWFLYFVLLFFIHFFLINELIENSIKMENDGLYSQDYIVLVYSIKIQQYADKAMTSQKVAQPPKYHPFNIPPNQSLYQKHRKCSQFGQPQQQTLTNTCPCCNQVQRNTLPIGCKIQDIYQISQPSGYYFTYIKLVTFALIVVMLITGVYTLIRIIDQCGREDVQDGLCLYVYGIPVPKIHVFFKETLIILNAVVIVVLYVFAFYLIYRHTYLHQKNLCGHQKPSDYSVMIGGFDHEKISIEDVRQFFQDYNIKDIIYTHRIKKYLDWLSRKSVLDAQYRRYINYNNPKSQKIKHKITKLQNKMLHTKNLLTLGQDKQFRTDKIIITFHQSTQKKKFQQLFGLTLSSTIYHTFCGGSPLIINQCALFIEPLGQPNQIIWENLEVTSKSRYLRVFVSNVVTVGLLCGSFVMVAYLSKGEEDQSAVGDTLLSLVFAILIQVVNEALTFIIDLFTGWEGRYTMTGEISMKLYKNCAAFFLNTTLLPFFLFILDWFNPEQDDLVRNILSIFFISNLISPYIGLILQPQYLLKQYWRRKIIREGNDSLITQIKANNKFQKTDFMLDQRYALISQLVMNCMFYAAIFPIGIVITIIGMFITYWSSKWWILNYCSTPKFSFKLGTCIKNVISCLFPSVYAFGYAANLYMVRKQVEFDRSYSIYIAAATVPITIFMILFAESISKRCILDHRGSIVDSINKKIDILTYKGLNPTTFIHDNLSIQVQTSNKDLWSKLVSYVAAKESGIIINDDPDGIDVRSSFSSSSSRNRQMQAE